MPKNITYSARAECVRDLNIFLDKSRLHEMGVETTIVNQDSSFSDI